MNNESIITNRCLCIIFELWPLILYGQISGCFPFTIRKEPPHTSKICPFLFLYSFLLHGFAFFYSTKLTKYILVIYNGDDFESKIYNIIIIFYDIFFLLMVISCWCSGNRLIKYFQEWCRFQFHCTLCTGKFLELNIRRKCLTLVITSIVFFISGAVTQGLIYGQINLFFIIPSILVGNVMFFSCIIFIMCCITCKLYFKYLKENFMVTFYLHHTCDQLRKWRRLFNSMYQLALHLGSSFATPWIIIFCFILTSFIISSFVCAMGLLNDFDGTILPFLASSISSIAGIIMFCYGADLVPSEVSSADDAFYVLDFLV